MSDRILIPLFPLGLVLLPGLPLPLHIFEERYKRMIGECLERDEVFGVVYYTGSEMKQAGCTARVAEVVQRYEDGRMDILTYGESRFHLEEQDQSKPYLQGWVRLFVDREEELGDEVREQALRGLIRRQELGKLTDLEDALETQASELDDISFVLAGTEGFSMDEKQAFLEMNSTAERIRRAVSALEKLIERRKLTIEIQRIIGGNGHPPSVLRSE
ncbi:MAG: LON peptidase substrate-binding domain-containing protein [Spirochaetales bacterium]|nr:LON peptidase substrate-binding domain-containing protein [Spirochaetales bacterium]